MKVEINHKGVLTITSETELESFALERWSDVYFKPIDHENSRFNAELVIQIKSH